MLNTTNVLGVKYHADYLTSRGLGGHPFAKSEPQRQSVNAVTEIHRLVQVYPLKLGVTRSNWCEGFRDMHLGMR
jgi:hypothetical protein